MKYLIPGLGKLELDSIILDLNGTLTIDGKLAKGVLSKIEKLKKLGFIIYLFSGDTRGNGTEIAKKLNITFIKTINKDDKADEIKKLNPDKCVAIGNGFIDIEKIKLAKLSIVTLQKEGAFTKTLLESDIIVPSIIDALDLLIDSNKLIATLRS